MFIDMYLPHSEIPQDRSKEIILRKQSVHTFLV